MLPYNVVEERERERVLWGAETAASVPAGKKRVAETGSIKGSMAEGTEAQLPKSPEPSKALRMSLTCWR